MSDRPRFWYPPIVIRLFLIGFSLFIPSGLLLIFLDSTDGPRTVHWVVWGVGVAGILVAGAGVIHGFIFQGKRHSGPKQ
jgi:hypothetical protein